MATHDNSDFSIGSEKGSWILLLKNYFAMPLVLVVVVCALFEYSGIGAGKGTLWDMVIDTLLIDGALFFMLASIYGYAKAKNMRIENAMFGFAMASLAFFIASCIRAWYGMAADSRMPFPSMADAFFLVGSLAMIAAIYSATKAISETLGIKLMLNEIIVLLITVVTTVAIVGAYALVTPMLHDGLTHAALASIVYTVLDSVSLAMTMNLIVVSKDRRIAESQLVIAVGTLILMVAHIYFSITMSVGFTKYEPLAIMLYAVAYTLYAMGVLKYVNLTRSDLIMDHLSKHSRL